MEVIEERVLIQGEHKIGATIAYSDKNKKSPLVLLIMGTGKTNRDGNMKGFKTDIYKTFSDMFVGLGNVCIRYDKRGTHESEGNFNTAGLFDLVNDASEVIAYAKKLDYVDENKIIVCGHSEGAMIATLLTKQENLEKIILLGGAGMSLKSALIYQNLNIIKEFENKKGFMAWYVRKLVTPKKIEKQLNSLFDKAVSAKKARYFYRGILMNSAWVREHGQLTNEDFVNILKEYKGKVLAITGTADLSADYKCLDAIKDFENVTTFIPENVNHILREVDDKNSYLSINKQYKRLAKNPIHEETKEKIADFLKMK